MILISLAVPSSAQPGPEEFGPFHTTLVKKEVHALKDDVLIPSTSSWVLNRFVRVFQVCLSPQDGPNCSYSPTCSQYSYLSINRYGLLLGTIMTADRYLRCNPFGAWGPDLPEENYIFHSHE